jgi:hypothetical protein
MGRGRGGTALSLLAGALLALSPVAAQAADPDKDGLPTAWEKGKSKKTKKLKLKQYGASPKHKDIFVEFAFGPGINAGDITCSGLDQIYDAFRDAPVNNPDGKRGIKIHMDADKNCSSRKYDLGGVSRFQIDYAPPCVAPPDVGGVLARNRLKTFHAGGIVQEPDLCGAEGFAGDTDFIVKDNGGGNFFGYVVMHELGHIFGTDHRPFNAFSVMSGGGYQYGENIEFTLDFTRYPVAALDETNLDENVGFSSTSEAGNDWLAQLYGPQHCLGDWDQNPGTPDTQARFHIGHAHGQIDFDCDGAQFWVPPYSNYIDEDPVSYDVNGDGVIGTVPGVSAEWPIVAAGLKNGRIGG